MLTPIDDVQQAAGTVAQADKQIAASSSTDGAVIYTVPSGRVFTGFVSNTQNSGNYYSNIEVAAVSIRHYGGFSNGRDNYKNSPIPELTLLAGTSVKNNGGSYDSIVFGVERDA